MAVCRLCGTECEERDLHPVQTGGGCVHCNGSPACSRCGHARRHHRGTFGGGEPACKATLPVEGTLSLGRCGCEGYTTDPNAFGAPTPIVDVQTPSLRIAAQSEAPVKAELAPVHDLFDQGRRLRSLDEFDGGVPWRPPTDSTRGMTYRLGVLRALLTRLRAWWRREAIADAEISREVVDHRRISDTEYTELGGKL